MTDAERDELIEKSLLNELDAASEARVQQLRQEDDAFRREYEFQQTLIQQVRLKRRQELLDMFADFDTEQDTETSEATTPVIPLSSHSNREETSPTDPKVISIWQQPWFRVAATVVLVLLGSVIVWQLSKYAQKPIAHDDRDTTKNQLPKDSSRIKPLETPRLPSPEPMGPVAQSGKTIRLKGPSRLPYYETDDLALGFGEGQKTREFRTVVFDLGPTPAYEFQDTLKVFLPARPDSKPAWSLVYSRANDTYYLITGKTRYEVVKGLQGRQPLKKVN